MSDWCAAFAKARGLEYHQDALNNIIIIKEAAPGYEGAEPVILQGHLDMVCEKEPGCQKDLEREGLDLEADGDFVTARGTTLGGDDGIAVAMALALLDARDLPHPRLEVVLTVDEEVGMLGAAALDGVPPAGQDPHQPGLGGGGGVHRQLRRGQPDRVHPPCKAGALFGSCADGLGGRPDGGTLGDGDPPGPGQRKRPSGPLSAAVSARTELRLGEAAGGQQGQRHPHREPGPDRGIRRGGGPGRPRGAGGRPAAGAPDHRPGAVPPRAEASHWEGSPMDRTSTERVVCLLTCLPNGVQAMSGDIPGLVQTSLNLGILTTGVEELRACFSVRSSLGSQKEALKDRLTCLTQALGGRTQYSGDYPAWEYKEDSLLRDRMVQVFREQYAASPRWRPSTPGWSAACWRGRFRAWTACPSAPTCWRSTPPGSG